MVVSDAPIASAVGAEILRRGGNAVDAAVATAFTLAVVYPEAGNIGGGGFMLIHLANGRNAAIDFREVAPLARVARHVRRPGRQDHRAEHRRPARVGRSGAVAGLTAALARYGTMSRAR
jgi:gamma-glutamyltranspeptidase/glutathione hydrolase